MAEYLLEQFHRTYPQIKQVFYKGVVAEILTTGMLQSQAMHHSWKHTAKLDSLKDTAAKMYKSYNPELGAWTRRCFGDPSKSKPQLNSYIAHPPQSLNAQTLNKAFLSVFNDIAINPQHRDNFKLNAQIHDSILFQYRKGHEHLIEAVKERMEVPVTIRAYDDKVRTFVVPAGAKHGQHLEKGYATYWSENE